MSDQNTNTLNVALYKNSTVKLCEVEIRCATNGQSEVFSLNKMILTNQNDYFELFCANMSASGRVITLTNLQMSSKI
jgi:hypothetical protein